MAQRVASHQGASGVVIDGLDEVVRDLTFRAVAIQPVAAKIVVEHAGKLAQKMRDLVPVDQGDVLDSITADQSATFDASGVYADAGPDPAANKAAFVARFLEHGTIKMAPRPFIGPAADQTLDAFVAAMKAIASL
jgi:HK97 gp10 family phage protein